MSANLTLAEPNCCNLELDAWRLTINPFVEPSSRTVRIETADSHQPIPKQGGARMRIAGIVLGVAVSAVALIAVLVDSTTQNSLSQHRSAGGGDVVSSTSGRIIIEIQRPGVTSSKLGKFGPRRVLHSDGVANGQYRAIAVDDG